jgi:hypothetical protein
MRIPGAMAVCAMLLALTAGAAAQGLGISEFLAINDGGLADEDGTRPDWIEIHNAGPATADLAGWHLTDNALNLAKWTFPATNLAAGGYLIVFASGKDRATAGQPLHANFKLDEMGEYLALVAPDGVTVASQFAPAYPRQRINISAGPSGPVDVAEPVPAGSPVLWHVPANDALGASWIQPGFADAGWAEGRTALGHDTAGSAGPVLSLDFNDRTTNLAAAGFSSFVLDSVGGAGAIQSSAVTRVFGDLRVTLSPVGGIGLDDRVRATPADAGAFTDSALLRDFVFAIDAAGNNGLDVEVAGLAAGRSYQVEIWSFDSGSSGGRVSDWSVNGELAADDYTFNGSVAPASNGQYRIACVVAADGTGGMRIEARRETASSSHGVFLNALRISPAPLLADIRTDTADAMLGRNATVYTRLPFLLSGAASVTGATLRVRHDDGFVAWLNGTEVASRNAPAVPAWDAAATAARTGDEALAFEAFEVPPALLAEGTNVLAVQGLNVDAGDADFFLLPVLETRAPASSPVRFFQTPTPGAANAAGYAGTVSDTHFDVDRGPKSNAFSVTITCATPGAQIRYTLDCSEPTPTTGIPYTGPVPVSGTTVLRACAFRAGWIPPDIDTLTYLYPDEVAQQPAAPPGWPATWGKDNEVNSNDGAGDGTVPADYEMDPNVTAATLPGFGVADALRGLPVMSVTLAPDAFLGASAGIYSHPLAAGDAWEKPCAVEYMPWEGGVTNHFHINAGIRVHGNSSRRPYRLQKHGFRIAMRGEYGASQLDYDLFPGCGVTAFDRLVLRPFFTDGWGLVSWDPARYRPDDSVCFRDVWMKESHRAMGHPAGAGSFVHLFINGLYWGVYNLTERVDERFCADHFGGLADDYDVLADFNELKAGTRTAWDAVQALAAAGVATPEAYAAFAEQVDIVNLADTMLLHFFADCEDWPHHNWYAVRSRVAPGAKWRFLVWDQEIALDNHAINRTASNHAGTPSALFQALRQNAEFRLLFADRVHRHLRNGGALGLEACRARWNALAAVLDKPIVAESARWGDTADETPYGNTESRPGVPLKREYTREADWLPAVQYVGGTYLPSLYEETNSFAIVRELRTAGLFPSVEAPAFSTFGGLVTNGSTLTVTAPTGTIHVTIDGTDPREAVTGDPHGAPYAGPLALTHPMTVRARARSDSGEWSAVTEAAFVPGVRPTAANVLISEIMYNPAGTSEDTEFLELWNPGADVVDLSGVAFTDGIGFAFADGQFLGAGARLLLVRNLAAFESAYGTGLPVAGVYTGGLDNAGETLALTGPAAGGGTVVLQSFAYDDIAPWPLEADGAGHSLTRVEGTGDPADPASWRISVATNGTPGGTDSQRFSGDPHADLDANGRPDLLDHAMPGGALWLVREAGGLEVLFDRRLAADDAVCVPEWSDDLAGWNPLDAATDRAPGAQLPGGLWLETWRPQSASPTSRYFRVRVHPR